MRPNATHNAFCFLDESGTLRLPSRYFALGAIVHPSPKALIEKLHEVFESLISTCRRDRTEQEFHWATLTGGTVEHYERCLSVLKADLGWRFFSVVIDLADPAFIAPSDPVAEWRAYLRWARQMLARNLRPDERVTLLADFLRRPKGEQIKLSDLALEVPQLWNVLPVASQGVVLVQMADVLLGASLYAGKDKVKVRLAAAVAELRNQVGRRRFHEWRVRWDK